MTMRPKWKMVPGNGVGKSDGGMVRGAMQRGKLIAIVELIGRRHTHTLTYIQPYIYRLTACDTGKQKRRFVVFIVDAFLVLFRSAPFSLLKLLFLHPFIFWLSSKLSSFCLLIFCVCLLFFGIFNTLNLQDDR